MKVIWEEDDIKPGINVGRPVRLERYKIGYHDASPKPVRYTLNSDQDGMVLGPMTKEDLAAWLNRNGELPAVALDEPHFDYPRR